MPKETEINSKLEKLAPEARLRVENALKANIEAELATSSVADKAGKEFSRGIIFSRSRGKMVGLDDKDVLSEMGGMDEATFSKFADRLKALKDIKDTGGIK